MKNHGLFKSEKKLEIFFSDFYLYSLHGAKDFYWKVIFFVYRLASFRLQGFCRDFSKYFERENASRFKSRRLWKFWSKRTAV